MELETTNLEVNLDTMKGVFDLINLILNESEDNQKLALDQLSKIDDNKIKKVIEVIEKINEFQKTLKKPLDAKEREVCLKKYLTASAKIDLARLFALQLDNPRQVEDGTCDSSCITINDLSIDCLKSCFPKCGYTYLYPEVKAQGEMCLFERGEADWQEVLDLVKNLRSSDGTVKSVIRIFSQLMEKVFD